PTGSGTTWPDSKTDDRSATRGADDASCGSYFFSSRRRHTSWPRDWSSDVCSSDLDAGRGLSTGAGLSSAFSSLAGRGISTGAGLDRESVGEGKSAGPGSRRGNAAKHGPTV